MTEILILTMCFILKYLLCTDVAVIAYSSLTFLINLYHYFQGNLFIMLWHLSYRYLQVNMVIVAAIHFK